MQNMPGKKILFPIAGDLILSHKLHQFVSQNIDINTHISIYSWEIDRLWVTHQESFKRFLSHLFLLSIVRQAFSGVFILGAWEREEESDRQTEGEGEAEKKKKDRWDKEEEK